MLPHAKIVVGAPNCDVLLAAVTPMPDGIRKGVNVALEVDEDSIPTFFMQTHDSRFKETPITQATILHSSICGPIAERQPREMASATIDTLPWKDS
jgi:hypothetical protein